MLDQRKELRVPQNKSGVIRFGATGYELPCAVIDLTRCGAGIALASVFGVPEVFQLFIHGETKARHCRVNWVQENRLGVSFD